MMPKTSHKIDKAKPLFNRSNQATHAVADLAFTGKGFMPDLLSEHALSSMPEASANYPVEEGVLGRKGMMPVTGLTTPTQRGQKHDEGSGGAGSFVTVTAIGAKG